jgi:hypothetical protein
MIAAACLVVLLVAPLPSRADDDFSCVKDSLSANHCFAGGSSPGIRTKRIPPLGCRIVSCRL